MITCKAFPRSPLTVIAIVLMLQSSLVHAEDGLRPQLDDGWGEWKVLSNGYIARRKVPPKALQLIATANKERKSETLAAGASTVQKTNKGKEDTQALWFNTLEEGLYRVPINVLASELNETNSGLRRKAAKGDFSLTNSGEPVSWYFDAEKDELLFVAERYDTFYTDKNVYRFALDHRTGSPMGIIENAPIISFGEQNAFTETLKFEEEPDYYFITWAVANDPSADFWFWDRLFGGYKDLIDVELNVPDPSPTGLAQVRIRLRGSSDMEDGDEHHVYAEINGTQVGPILSWDGFEEAVLVADFDQGLLMPGGNNTLRLRNGYTPGEHPIQWLDDIELTYARLPVAENGSLWLHDTIAGTQAVTGFSSQDIFVIESPGGVSVVRQDLQIEPDGFGGWAVTFEADAGLDYLVVEGTARKVPEVSAVIPSKIKELSDRTEYLVVAPREFAGTANALSDYRKNRFKHRGIVWLDEIYAEFSGGKVDPSAISRFMQWINSRHFTPAYIVLLGKGTVDHKDRMAYGDSYLPLALTPTPWTLAASDEQMLSGDKRATFAIGRIPITSDAEGMGYIQKLIDYELALPGNEHYEAVLVADNPDASGDFHENSEALTRRLLNSHQFDLVTSLYHPQDSVRASLTDSVTWEAGYISYDGHGSAVQIGDFKEKFISTADAQALQNVSYPVFTALTCASGNYALPGIRSLAGSLVLNPTGGAVASFAPTGLSLDLDAQVLGNAFVDSLFAGNTTIGEAVRDAKINASSSISAFMPSIYSVVGEPAIYAREE